MNNCESTLNHINIDTDYFAVHFLRGNDIVDHKSVSEHLDVI